MWATAAWISVGALGCGPGPIDVELGASLGAASEDPADDGDPSAGDSGLPGSDDGIPQPGETSATDDGSWGSEDASDSSSDSGNPGGLPNGSSCTSDPECASNRCATVPFFGGFCGECLDDADCPSGGCSSANPFDAAGSVCNQGELGGGCDSDEVCAPGLTCARSFDLLDVIQFDNCSECQTDGDCGPGLLCTPVVGLVEFAGARLCLLPGSLPQGESCELEGAGALHCASGVCSVVDIMGLAQMGACGQCDTDMDCSDGLSCVPGQLDLESGELFGSVCG